MNPKPTSSPGRARATATFAKFGQIEGLQLDAGTVETTTPAALNPSRFMAQARAFGFSNGIVSQSQAVQAFVCTAKGKEAYERSRNFFADARARAGAVDDVIAPTAVPDQTHPFMALVLQLTKERGLPVPRAALSAAIESPSGFRDWCQQWAQIGQEAPFKDILKDTEWENQASLQ